MGYTPDISEYLNHSWYDWVWYLDTLDNNNYSLGRWLGPAHNSGQGLAYYVLNKNGKIVTRSTVFSLTQDEISDPSQQEKMEAFTKSMESLIGNECQSTSKNMDSDYDTSGDIYHNLFEESDNECEDVNVNEDEGRWENDAPYMENDDNII